MHSNSNDNVIVIVIGVITFLITFGGTLIAIFKYLNSIREEARKNLESLSQKNFDFRVAHEKAMGAFAVNLEKNFAQKESVIDLYDKYNKLSGDVEMLKGKMQYKSD